MQEQTPSASRQQAHDDGASASASTSTSTIVSSSGSDSDDSSDKESDGEEYKPTVLDLWPDAELRRLEVAVASLVKAAAWESLRHFRVQPQGTEMAVLQEVTGDVLAELSCMNSSIAEDEALLASLQSQSSGSEGAPNAVQTDAAGQAGTASIGSTGREIAQQTEGGQQAEVHQAEGIQQAQDVQQAEVAGSAEQHAVWAQRQVLAVRYRLERKRLRRTLVGLLAVLRHAWGDSTLLEEVLSGKVSGV